MVELNWKNEKKHFEARPGTCVLRTLTPHGSHSADHGCPDPVVALVENLAVPVGRRRHLRTLVAGHPILGSASAHRSTSQNGQQEIRYQRHLYSRCCNCSVGGGCWQLAGWK